jgi:hypothetical protein
MAADQALRLADLMGLEQLLRVVTEGFQASMPETKAEAPEEPSRPRKPGLSTA